MRTLILSVLFVLAVVGAGVAAFGHEIPGFSHKHEGSEATKKKARPQEKVCMFEAPTAGDLEAKLNELGCKKGDIIGVWYVSQLPRTMRRIPATATRICDYSDASSYETPFAGTEMGMQWNSCRYIGYVREISLDKESREGVE